MSKNPQFINYELSLLHIKVKTKHLFKDKNYNAYVFEDNIIICTVLIIISYKYNQETYDQNPKYIFPLNFQNSMTFLLDEQRQNHIGFCIQYKNKEKKFYGQNQDLLALKLKLGNNIFFENIRDFYQPIRLLGQGNQCQVYLAESKINKEYYAIKCLPKQQIETNQLQKQAIINEIECLKRLKHPNIIQMFEQFDGENTYYLVYEYLYGETLNDYLRKQLNQPLQKEKIRQIMKQILDGVQHMHLKKVMHRDIKPENFIFKNTDNLQELKLIDFGLATLETANKFLYPKCGTPGYVAPEIANLSNTFEKYDCSCDLFSVGCIMYKLLTQREPFQAQNPTQVLRLNQKCNLDFEILRLYNVDNVELDLLQSLLEKDPSKRISATNALCHKYFKRSLIQQSQKFKQEEISNQIKKDRYQTKQESDKLFWKTTNFEKSSQLDCLDFEDEAPQVQQLPNFNNLIKNEEKIKKTYSTKEEQSETIQQNQNQQKKGYYQHKIKENFTGNKYQTTDFIAISISQDRKDHKVTLLRLDEPVQNNEQSQGIVFQQFDEHKRKE